MGAVLLSILLGTGFALPSFPPPARRGVYSISFALPTGANIGNRKSGALCLPAGRWRMGDFRQDEGRMVRAVERALRDAGRPVRRPSDPEFGVQATTTEWRLSAQVTALSLSGCSAWGPTRRAIGASDRIRGSGEMTIRWRLYSTAARAVVREGQTRVRYDFGPDIRDLAGAVEQGVVANALGLGPEWWRD